MFLFLKYYWLGFSQTSQKAARTVGASWRKARAPPSEEGQARERRPHRSSCEPVLVWNWSAPSPKHTKPKSPSHRNHKFSQRSFKQRGNQIKSRDRRLTTRRTTDLGWPAMRRPQTGRGGWRGGGERPAGASSQTHALRPALDLKHKTNTAGHAGAQRHIHNRATEITLCFEFNCLYSWEPNRYTHTHRENVTLIVSVFLFHSIKDAIIAPEHEISIYLCFYHSPREDLLNSERGVIPAVCLIGWSRLVSIKKKIKWRLFILEFCIMN